MRYLLEVKSLSPLALARHPVVVGEATPTLDYISGTALRSAIASEFLRQGVNPSTPLFQRLFLHGGLCCGNLYPVIRGIKPSVPMSLPLPMTAMTCKLERGFLYTDRLEEAGHGVVDTLIATLSGHRWEQEYDECLFPGCGGSLDPFSGFYEKPTPGTLRGVRLSTRLIARTAMSSRFGMAAHGQLHAVEALEENLSFSGYLEVAPAIEACFLAYLVEGETTLPIGRGRTRGMGEALVAYVRPDTGPYLGLEDPAARLEAFQEPLTEKGWNRQERLIPITMYTDVIVMDDYMRYSTAVEPEVLRYYTRYWPEDTPRCPEGLEMVHANAHTRLIGGWNAAQHLPKWPAIAIERGSVFVFAVPEGQWSEALAFFTRLEEEGLGERREEGFGQIVLAHPFHREVNPK
ncbi:MAG: hypothetical protein FJ026_08355 [Chloroflexi bacterium]|nr:hypothetical protein [Chloroflexota bacterium]